MRTRRGLAVFTLFLAIGGVTAAGGEPDPPGDQPLVERTVRNCESRVEGGVIRPKSPRDTVAGPFGWIWLPSNFAPSQAGKDVGDLPSPPIKALAIARAPRAVTVTVPRAQRAWMLLSYAWKPDRSGFERSYVAEFTPCPRSEKVEEQRQHCATGRWADLPGGREVLTACRSGYTQFNGVIFVDYETAPWKGRCARLRVEVDGRERTWRPFIFGASRRCRRPRS